MPVPYFGVTGFGTQEEVKTAVEAANAVSKRTFMVGVLMSSTTLQGKKNRWAHSYPPREEISTLFMPTGNTLNLIHFSTDFPNSLAAQLDEASRYGGLFLEGFQLNIAWPMPEELTTHKQNHPRHIIVLQLGEKALGDVEYSPIAAATKLRKYFGLVNYILLDRSGGRGQYLDSMFCMNFLSVLRHKVPLFGLGVAGGLSAETLPGIRDMLRVIPNLSFDAQGKLRNQADDTLTMTEVIAYINTAARLLGG